MKNVFRNIVTAVFLLVAVSVHADTYTTNLNMVKPTAKAGTVGAKINSDLDILDAKFPGGSPAVTIKDEGTTKGTAGVINFTGAGVTASTSGGTATVNIPGGTGCVPSGSSILMGDGAGGCSNVTVGTGLTLSTGTLAASGGGSGVATGVQELTTANLSSTSGDIQRVTDGGAAGALVIGDGSNPTCDAQKSLKIYIPTCPPWNVKGDNSTDDTSAWNAFIKAIPNGSMIWLPYGFQMKFGGMDLSGKTNLYFRGTVSGSGSSATGGQPAFIYNGSAGGTMVTCSPCRTVTFDGIFFHLSDLADYGIKAMYNGSPTYNLKILNSNFYIGPAGTRTNAIAVDWCGTGTTSNCEQLVVKGNQMYGSNMGSNSILIRIGHSNARENIIEDNVLAYSHVGIYVAGKTTIGPNLYDHNDIDIQGAASEPVTIIGGATENGKQFWNGYASGLTIDGMLFGSHDPVPAACWIYIPPNHGEARLDLRNSVFTNTDTLDPFCSYSSSTLDSRNNWYSTSIISGRRVPQMANFYGGYSSFGDNGNGVRSEITTGFDLAATASPGTTGIYSVNATTNITGTNTDTAAGMVGQITGVLGTSKSAYGIIGKYSNTNSYGSGIAVGAQWGSIAGAAAGAVYGVKVDSLPSITGAGIPTAYGLYVGTMSASGITTGYGIYQADSSDKNFFAGTVQLGNYTSNGCVKTGSSNGTLSIDTACLTASGPTMTNPIINTGVAQGSGLKHQRVTTGSITQSSDAAVTLTWTSAFADANYTTTCSVVEADTDAATLRVDHIESVSASTVVVRIANADAGAAKTGVLNCIGLHD